MFNTVILSGRLTADVELRTTQSGVAVASFTIANESGYGENKKTNFINIVAWRSTAELIAKHFYKGSMIGIEGAIQTRKYQDKEGNNRTAFEVVANRVEFMESKKDQGESTGQNPQHNEVQESDDFGDLPF